MKKTNKLIAITVIVISLMACKTKELHKGYLITGTVVGVEEGTIKFFGDTIETAIVNGKFELKGVVEATDVKYLQINDTYGFQSFISNETFSIKVDINDADERGQISDVEIVGSKINDEYKAVTDKVRNTPESKKLQELFEIGKTLEKDSEAYKENYEAISNAREASVKVQTEFIKNYALNNPNSFIAAFYMRFQANEVDQTFEEFQQIVEGFSDEVKKSPFYKPLKDELDGLKKTAIGQVAPDFTLKTDANEDFTLSSLRGQKIVLVDFWASWCVPCRKSYPHLKEVYAKYKDKGFEVVAVTNDSNHDQWKKAIKEDGLEWIQVADVFPPKGSDVMTAKVITSYAAPFLPSTYLLDKNGVIIAKHLHGNELDKKLEEIFGF